MGAVSNLRPFSHPVEKQLRAAGGGSEGVRAGCLCVLGDSLPELHPLAGFQKPKEQKSEGGIWGMEMPDLAPSFSLASLSLSFFSYLPTETAITEISENWWTVSVWQ